MLDTGTDLGLACHWAWRGLAWQVPKKIPALRAGIPPLDTKPLHTAASSQGKVQPEYSFHFL